MPIVGGLGIHRKQITFGYLDTVAGEVRRGQIALSPHTVRDHTKAIYGKVGVHSRRHLTAALTGQPGLTAA